jgi:non-ribosomal peptide synthetase component F
VLAEGKLREGKAYARSRDYWMARLDSLPPAPDLPLACAPASIRSPQFIRRAADISAPHWQALKTAAKQRGVTPSALALTAFAEVIGTWSRHPRFTINLTLFNRLPLHPQINDIVGDFTSLNLLQIDRSNPASFAERARANQQQLWNDLEHRHFGGVQVIRELNRRRGSGPAASMPVVFTSDLSIASSEPASELERQLSDQRVGISHTPQIWLDVAVMERDGALAILMDSVDELFPAGVLDAMFAAYRALLEGLAESDAAWERGDGVGLPSAQRVVRARVNATQAEWSQGLLHAGFVEQAERTPEALAVWSSALCLSYGQLRQLSRYYAHQLRAAGVERGELVGVVMHKGWQQVVAVLAILEAGAAYLPIDASLPATRIEQLLGLGGASRVLTQAQPDAELAWPAGLLRWVVDAQALGAEALPALPVVQDLDALAYVISPGVDRSAQSVATIIGCAQTIDDINARFAVGSTDRIACRR